jgi:putative FmdB family regulatory protein
MPTYTYQCRDCHKRQESVRRVAERDDCPRCNRCYGATERRITPTMVATGFQPYKTVAFDKETGKPMLIRSRAEHRAFLSRNGYEEVGNDKSCAPLPPEEIAYRRKQALKEQEQAPPFEFNEETHEASA